jgi:aconitate hydratase 2/2-methylisocitrate dehydratase
LSAVAQGLATSPLVPPLEAVRLLATMIGGYNVGALIALLSSSLMAQGLLRDEAG